MNASSLEKLSIHISNSWILGCSVLSCGIITCAYLNCISNISIQTRLELQNPNVLKKEDAYYWNIYKVVFITSMTGLSVIALRAK